MQLRSEGCKLAGEQSHVERTQRYFMARPTQTRRGQRYLGDENNMIVHDLERARGACEIDEILDESRGVRFDPDTVSQAESERYRRCTRCFD